MRPLIFVSVVCYYVCVVGGQSCTTPNGISGTCMDVLNCKPLAAIVNSGMLTQADVDFLRKSQCGTGSTPYTVCCPPENNRQQNNCFTPDGITGRCVDIYECNHIAALLNPPVSQQNINTIKSLQCPGKTEYSVCCAATPTNQNNNGNTQNSCRTPDGNSGRCVDIYQCAHMAALLNPPVTQKNINLIQQSQCPGPSEYSVCCGPPPITKYNGQGPRRCKDNVSAYPPDPSTECCGLDSVAGNKIVGGTETRIDQYPWLALINYYKNGAEVPNLVCGGALISGRYVLTAAHCLAPMQRGTARMVTLGEYDRSHEGRDCTLVEANGQDCTDEIMKIPIQSFKMHEEYDPNTIKNDIGLIRLATLAPYTDFIRPICLPRTDQTLNPPANFTMYSAGWGAANTREPSSALKLHVDLPFVSAEQCKRRYSFVWDKHVCAGGVAGKDTCKGDSGGPLMYENGKIYEVLGVVSFGLIACGTQNSPGVYTKVFEYKQWITSNINP